MNGLTLSEYFAAQEEPAPEVEPLLVRKLRDWLEDRHLAYSPLDTAAQFLYMTTRALQRELSVLGYTYTQLVEQERRRRFDAVFPATLSELTEELDYSHHDSVLVIVRRWFGMPLRDYRRAYEQN